MPGQRMHLRSRVLLLTTAFAVTLFSITFGLSWRAKVAQEQWSRLLSVETRAIGTLDEIIRAHNAFRRTRGHSYDLVLQLVDSPSLATIDTSVLRRRMTRFRDWIEDRSATRDEIDTQSRYVVTEAQRLIDERKLVVAEKLPALERQSRQMMSAGLAIAWILVLCSFAAVQITLRKVVRPLEDLSHAADRIAAGDLNAHAPVGGDSEIATLGMAFNHMTDKLRAHARTDELTELANFRAFRERLDGEIARASRYPEQFGILVLDLDRFKQYNDRFGHLAGNDALQRVARVIRETVRSVDFPARYGGEEFAVIVPQIDVVVLGAIAERIRSGVEALSAPADGGPMTVSIGAAIYPIDGTGEESLFHAADERLYQAKREGRNRVVTPVPVRQSTDRQSA
jgi:diguanylate cyclase (GGDEF)-like protein